MRSKGLLRLAHDEGLNQSLQTLRMVPSFECMSHSSFDRCDCTARALQIEGMDDPPMYRF